MRIRLYGDPILRQRAEPVGDVTDETRALVDAMALAMREADGVGLSAPQVGELTRIVVIDPSSEDEPGEVEAFVNPVVVASEGRWTAEEGCLSLPDVYADVPRAETVVVKWVGLDGTARSKRFSDWTARVLQHELDHLDGVLFIDRISALARFRLRRELQALKDRQRGED